MLPINIGTAKIISSRIGSPSDIFIVFDLIMFSAGPFSALTCKCRDQDRIPLLPDFDIS